MANNTDQLLVWLELQHLLVVFLISVANIPSTPLKTVMYSISFSSVNMETAGNMMVDIYYMSEHDVQSLAEKGLVTVFPNGGELQQA